ncbi:MAG: ShlB/FhaC/HecB family hemolysin secretion/activation protein [Cyanosarcina radialis HA8281-LM2]|jgi:hemolysin activation/secretion protein|nr:ShlB/FhaC/HecB family hemolysin secretion/activation protein [Cyanosarcina radialis HA8281-LM2]
MSYYLKFASIGSFFLVSHILLAASIAPSHASVSPHLTADDRLEARPKLSQNQPDPNQERFPQPLPTPAPLPPETQPPVLPTPTPEPSPPPSETGSIQVEKIEVKGSTVFTPEDFRPITQKVEGRTVTLEELTEVANQITQLYLDRGFLTSRAIVTPQAIANGIVEINIIEGSIEQIEIQGTNRLNPGYVRSRIQLATGTPLNVGKLEEQLRLLRADPLLANVEASLRSGSEVGKSILIVRVTESKSININLSFDNYSPPSVGSERFGIAIGFLNLSGIGDRLDGEYYFTTSGGADVFDFSYQVPLNPMNGTLKLRAAPNSNRITQQPFDVLDIKGQSDLYEISYRQPLVRTLREEFALSLGFTHQQGQTFTFANIPTALSIGPDENGISRTSVFRLGQDYIKRDPKGAWAFRSLFSLGTGLFDATSNPDPIPDGRFFSWLGQAQRVQVLSDDHLLIVQGEIQLTPDTLLPSEQFVVGGGQSVRGYRQNVRAGDNGFRFSIEDRITLSRDASGASILILSPFADLGYVWNNSDNPNILQRQKFLAGLGLGLLWEPIPNLNLRLDYGLPLVNLDDRGDNIQDDGLYFSVNYNLKF